MNLAHIFGLDSGSGYWYLWWSGLGSDIAEVAIIGGLITLARKHNCHVKGCWKVGRQQVQGTTLIVCRAHHPDGKPTHADVLDAHYRARR